MSLYGVTQSTEMLRCVDWLLAEAEMAPESRDQEGGLNAKLILQDG